MSAWMRLPQELLSQHIIYSLPLKEVVTLPVVNRYWCQRITEVVQQAGFTSCREICQTAAVFARILPVLQKHDFCRDGATWGEVSLGEAARVVWWIRRRDKESSKHPLYKVLRVMVHMIAQEVDKSVPCVVFKKQLGDKIGRIKELLQEKSPSIQSKLFLQLPKEMKCDPEIALMYLISALQSPVVNMLIRYGCAFAANPQDGNSWETEFVRAGFVFETELIKLFHSHQVMLRVQAIVDMFADKDVSSSLKQDQGFMEAACTISGWLLAFASEDSKSSQQVILAALHQNSYAIRFAAEALRDDKRVVRACVKSPICGSIFLDNKWILQEPLINPLGFAGDFAKNDFYTVLLSVRRYGPKALLQANARFFNNRYMFKACLQADSCKEAGLFLFTKSDLLRKDMTLMRTFSMIYPHALSACYRFLPKSMQKDQELLDQLPWHQRWLY